MKRRLLLSLLSVVAVLVTLELLLRVLGVAAPLRAFESVHGDDGIDYLQVRTKPRYALHSRKFRKHKIAGRLRVFAFGGSTTFGMPYTIAAGKDGDVSFPTWLREDVLQRYNIDLEVINCGAIGMPIEGVRELVEECLDYQPDAFLVLSGENEFLPHALLAARSRVRSLFSLGVGSPLRHIRLIALLEQFAISLAERFSPDLGTRDYPIGDAPVRAAFHTQDEYDFIHRRFAETLRSIIDLCKAHNVKLVLGTSPGNLKDYEPSFSALTADSDAEAAAWWKRIGDGRAAFAAGKLEEARDLFQAAVNAHPEGAESQYRLGLVLAALKQPQAARQALERARDLDGAIRRATSGILSEVRAAVDDAGAPTSVALADCDAEFGRASEMGLPGANLFVDHVHPTLDGVVLIVKAMREALEHVQVITIPTLREPDRTLIEDALKIKTELKLVVDLTIGINYANLIMLRHYDPEYRFQIAASHLQRVIEYHPGWAKPHWHLGALAVLSHHPDQARAAFDEATKHDPRWKSELRSLIHDSPSIQKIFRDEGFGDLIDH